MGLGPEFHLRPLVKVEARVPPTALGENWGANTTSASAGVVSALKCVVTRLFYLFRFCGVEGREGEKIHKNIIGEI